MKYEYYELIQNTLETTIVKLGLKTHANNKQLQCWHAKMFNITKNITELWIGNNKTALSFLEVQKWVNDTFAEKIGDFLHQFISD